MNKLYKTLMVFIFLILTFCSSHCVFGKTYFSDDFSSNLDKWIFVPGSEISPDSWIIENDELVGNVGYNGYSYLYPKFDTKLLTKYTIEADMFSVSGVDMNIFFKQSNDKQNYYALGFRSNDPLWDQDNNNIVLYKYEYGYSLLEKYPSSFIPRTFNLTQNSWHKVKIVIDSSLIQVYYDNQLAISYLDNGTVFTGGAIAMQNWGGNYPGRIINKIDNFKVTDGVSQNKIILIPGMGASWNERAMVLNQVVPQSEWRMTPFVHNYDSLISSFEQNGLVKGTDYFVYNYDWRKSLDNQVNYFNTFVNGLGLVTGEKIDIVGHSLGGVIGRIWTQENSSKVNKILTLASPNSGSVKTYEMWNGAKIANPLDSGSIALNVLLSLQRKNNQSSVETMRQYVPIVKDLLPTFDYLKKGGKIVAPMSNAYLANKNLAVSSIFSNLLTVSGYGFNTTAWINLEDRNVFDSVLGRWELGKPVSYIESDGDGTVLIKSAIFEGDGSSSISAKHGDIPSKAANLVLTELGLGTTISDGYTSDFDGAVFYIGSPATMKVNCGDGDILENEGFVLVSQKKYSECQVNLVGNANGTYHLVMGNSNDAESWKYAEGNIVTGEEKNISINSTDYWYLQMKRETEALLASYPTNNNLKNMMMAINSKNRTNLLNSYLLFRKQKLETVITWRMVNYLEQIINLELPNQSVGTIEKQKVLAMGAKVLADKTASLLQRNKIYPKVWQSLNYNQGEDLLKDVTYGKYLLAEKIFAMVWN